MVRRSIAHSSSFAALAAVAAAQGTLFPTSHSYPAVDAPLGGALGDLNGDGKLDCVVPNYFANKVSIYLGTGTGTLVPQPALVVGGEPRALALADLNGDTKLDLVTANATSDSVSVLLGTGTGTFAAPSVFPAGSFPMAIATGDLDGDGDQDVVVSAGGDSLQVLENDGAGGLSGPVPQFLGFTPDRIELAYMNGDTNLDCVGACWLDERVIVALGDGSGNLVGGAHKFASSPKGLAVGDVDGDGRPDVVTASSQTNVVTVFRGQANGGLGAPKTVWLGAACNYPTAVMLADASGDGRDDLIVTAASSKNITVMIGSGGGNYFEFALTSPGVESIYDAVAGDLNGDGFADVVASNETDDTIRAFVGSGVGSWEHYCTAKVNSLGCTPNLYATGTPSVSNPRPFWVIATSVLDSKLGLFVYKVNGVHANTPFHGGTLCVGLAPVRRTPVQNSAGDPKFTPPNCTGSYGLDFNAFAVGAAGGNPDPALLVVGNSYQLQVWSRDPGFAPPNDAGLTSALDVTPWL